ILFKVQDFYLFICTYMYIIDKFNVTHIDRDTHEVIQLCPATAASCSGDERILNWSDASWYYNGTWEKKDIAWPSDKHNKFGPTKMKSGLTNRAELQTWQNVTLPNTDDDDLIVWMRTAAGSEFTKLYRINHQLKFKKGDTLM
ncbi:hypothetical protein RFI_33801, partial [Reticulomyxa filosa]